MRVIRFFLHLTSKFFRMLALSSRFFIVLNHFAGLADPGQKTTALSRGLVSRESAVFSDQPEKYRTSGGNNACGAQRIQQTVQRRGDFFRGRAVWGCKVGDGASHRHRAGRTGGTSCASGSRGSRGTCRACRAGCTRSAIRTGGASRARSAGCTRSAIRTGGASRARSAGRAIRTGSASRTRCAGSSVRTGGTRCTCCACCTSGSVGTCCTSRAGGSVRARSASRANTTGGTGSTRCTGGTGRAAGWAGSSRCACRAGRACCASGTRGSGSTGGALRPHQSHGSHRSLRTGWPCGAGRACGTYRAGNGAAGRNAAVSPAIGRALIHFHSKNHPSVVVWSGFRVFDAEGRSPDRPCLAVPSFPSSNRICTGAFVGVKSRERKTDQGSKNRDCFDFRSSI